MSPTEATTGGVLISCVACPLHYLPKHLYCRACREAVCSACAIGEQHAGHPTCLITDVVTADLAALGAAVESTKLELKETLGRQDAKREAVEREVTRVKLEIWAHFRQLREQANLRELQLLDAVGAYQRQKLDDIEKGKATCVETLAAVEGSNGGNALSPCAAPNAVKLTDTDGAKTLASLVESRRRARRELESDVTVHESISFMVDGNGYPSAAPGQGCERLCVRANTR